MPAQHRAMQINNGRLAIDFLDKVHINYDTKKGSCPADLEKGEKVLSSAFKR